MFDNFQGGHHPTYLRIFSKAFLELGYKVIVFCLNPDDVSKWIDLDCPQKKGYLYTIKVQKFKIPKLPIIGSLPRSLEVLSRWQYTAKVIKEETEKIQIFPDLVFFPWLDSYLSYYLNNHIIDRIFPYYWTGIFFHPRNIRDEQHFLPILRTPLSHYAILKSPRCFGIGVLDECENMRIQQEINKKVILFPDITDEAPPNQNYEISRKIQAKANRRKIVGLVGSLSKRKGLLTLLEVAEKSIRDDWFFVFAGKLETSSLSSKEMSIFLEVVESQPHNCFFHLERIPHESQFNSIINICNVLFAAYENFKSSSNILTKAAVFKKPVIVSEGFCMDERVKKYNLGVSIAEGDVNRCIEALAYLRSELDANFSHLKPDFEEYASIQSVEKLRTSLSAICGNLI
jgi:glycosyltransferase involved in cell wall biosynthesis